MRVLAYLALTILLPLGAGAAETCSCQESRSVVAAFQFAQRVFAGEVTEVKDELAPKTTTRIITITFDVYQVWKGPAENTISLVRVLGLKNECDFQFVKGEQYLVYADKTSSDVYRFKYLPPGMEILDATSCNRTKLLGAADNDKKVLGAGAVP